MKAPSRISETSVNPAKRYFTIGEVSLLLGVEQSALRYWEREIPQLGPIERRNNRRYYQQRDIHILQQIQSWRDQGINLKGISQRLAGEETAKEQGQPRLLVRQIIKDLESLLRTLKT